MSRGWVVCRTLHHISSAVRIKRCSVAKSTKATIDGRSAFGLELFVFTQEYKFPTRDILDKDSLLITDPGQSRVIYPARPFFSSGLVKPLNSGGLRVPCRRFAVVSAVY